MPSSPGAQPVDPPVVSCSTPPETEAIAAYPIADDGSGAKDDPPALAAHAVVRFSATPEPGWEESVCELFSAGRANFAVAVARIPDASDASLCDVPVEPTPSLALVADSVDVSVSIEVVSMDVPCSDMRVMRGKKRAYLYSANVMTDSYARWSFLANEGDDVVTCSLVVSGERGRRRGDVRGMRARRVACVSSSDARNVARKRALPVLGRTRCRAVLSGALSGNVLRYSVCGGVERRRVLLFDHASLPSASPALGRVHLCPALREAVVVEASEGGSSKTSKGRKSERPKVVESERQSVLEAGAADAAAASAAPFSSPTAADRGRRGRLSRRSDRSGQGIRRLDSPGFRPSRTAGM